MPAGTELDRHHLVPILSPVFHPPERVTASAHHRLCRVHWSLAFSGASSSSSTSVATVARTTVSWRTWIASPRMRENPMATAPRREVSNASLNACLTAGSERSVRLTTVCVRATRAHAGETATIVAIPRATSPASIRTMPLPIDQVFAGAARVSIGRARARSHDANYLILRRFELSDACRLGKIDTGSGKKYFVRF